MFAPSSMVSPLNALPTPWGPGPSSSTSSSPTESTSGGIRLQRVPTAVRLATDMLSSSPSASIPLSAGGRLQSPKPEFFLGTHSSSSSSSVGGRPPLPSPTEGSSTSIPGLLPHTPSATPETSPAPFHEPLSVAAPYPSPTGELEKPQSFLSASASMPSSVSRSAPKQFFGHGHSSSSKSRPSLPPPTAFDALLYPPPSSADSAQNLHQRYRDRTSIHESSLAQSVGRSQGRGDVEFQSLSTSGDHDPDDYARYIMSTRSAKMQKWRRNSQVRLSILVVPFLPPLLVLTFASRFVPPLLLFLDLPLFRSRHHRGCHSHRSFPLLDSHERLRDGFETRALPDPPGRRTRSFENATDERPRRRRTDSEDFSADGQEGSSRRIDADGNGDE